MHKNFSIGQSNEVLLRGQTFDLHNFYDFSGLVVLTGRQAQLWFAPNAEYCSNDEALVIDFQGVDVLETTPNVLLGMTRDVDEVGYKNPDDRDLDWLLAECHAADGDHLVFRLGLSDHIRIHGQRAELQVRADPLASLTSPHTSP